jgi:hypothetical protein
MVWYGLAAESWTQEDGDCLARSGRCENAAKLFLVNATGRHTVRINMTKMRTSVKTGMITWKLLERASARAQGAETNLTNLWWFAGKSKPEEGRGRSTGRKSRRTTIPDDVGKKNRVWVSKLKVQMRQSGATALNPLAFDLCYVMWAWGKRGTLHCDGDGDSHLSDERLHKLRSESRG